ncbi:MAG: hypothetical protein ABI867_09835 [Kofleriaceae bacterium]
MDTTNTVFCCVQCRLLQPPTTSCVDCGAPTAPLDLVRELLYYRDMKLLSHRDWGLITAFLAGSSLALPILMPFAIGSMIALAVNKLRNLRKRNAIAGITMPVPVTTPGARTLYGQPRRFRATLPSLVDDAPVLLEHAVVRDRKGAVLLRRSEVVPFLLDVEHREPVLVTGFARMMTSTSILAQRMKVRRGDPRLAKMGVPDDLAVAGELEIVSIVADGPNVAITGVVEDEAVAELAFHRDGGSTPVMRGRLGAPVLVEDPRLIAAAL